MDNSSLFFTIFNLHNLYPWLTPFAVFSTNYLPYLMFALAVVLAIKGGAREKKALLLIIIGLVLIYPVTSLIRLFIQEPRPFLTYPIQPLIPPPTDLAFPSGHSSRTAIMAFSFIFSRSNWALLFIPLMLWAGFTRVYVGVHYPLDVLGGFAVGFLITFLIAYFFNKLRKNL